MPFLHIFLLFAGTAIQTLAAPTLIYPLAGQSPTIARVSTAYSYAPYTGTFESTSTLTYTATGLPAWLSFDAATVMFSGTPSPSDIGSIPITLTAADSTTDTTSTSFDLLVTDAPSPVTHQSISTQIADPSLHQFSSAVSIIGSTGVVVHPYYSFAMGFQQSTFRPAYTATADQSSIYYSAHLRGTNSLPSWLGFDNTTVTFNGVAPPQGTYTIVVVGSDVWGYEAVESSFTIQVGTTYLDFASGMDLGNITTVAGAMVNKKIDLTGLQINGNLIGAAAQSSIAVTPDLTSFTWLTYSATTMSLTGRVPTDFVNGTTSPLYVDITFTDNNATTPTVSSLQVYLPITIRPALFTTLTFPNVTAIPGKAFTYSLEPYIRDPSQISNFNLTITPASSLSSWLSFNRLTYSFSGTPPNASSLVSRADTDAQVTVAIAATEVGTGLMSTANLLVGISGVLATTTRSVSATTSPTTSTLATGVTSSGGGGISTAGKIALGVVCGLIALTLLLLLLLCLRRKRRAKEQAAAGEKSRQSTGGDSFMGMIKSPKQGKGFRFIGTNNEMPRSGSAKLQNGETPQFATIYQHRNDIGDGQGRPAPMDMGVVPGEQPKRMDAMKGILGWGGNPAVGPRSSGGNASIPPLEQNSPAIGEIVEPGTLYPNQEGSEFTHSYSSESPDSRASWESRESFHWSSAEGPPSVLGANGQRISGVPSVPRPRSDFTPRYPRNASAGALARLVRPPSEAASGRTFSEFRHSPTESEVDSLSDGHSHAHTGSQSHGVSRAGSSPTPTSSLPLPLALGRHPAGYTPGPSALGRAVDSSYFDAVKEEDDEDELHPSEHYASAAVVARAGILNQNSAAGPSQRQPRLMASKERFASSPTAEDLRERERGRAPSQEAMGGEAFDDADEERVRDSIAFAPSQVGSDVQGLGYPQSAIFFGSPPQNPQVISPRSSVDDERQRITSIRMVPTKDVILSPPLPQVGNLLQTLSEGVNRDRRSTNSAMHDGRYIAQANQNFNLHPYINPRPQVSLSAATWSSAPQSTYRAESANEKPLPKWLHFDAKELELWGIPSLADEGEIFTVKIMAKMPPREKRRSYDSSQVFKDESTDKEVGRVTIEVVDGLKSPDAFSLDGYLSPTAL